MRTSPLDLTDHPIIQAPMAGGPGGPALAAAVSTAGGLGFLAGGYKTPEGLRDEIEHTRRLTSAPFGVNLFVPAGPSEPPVDETAVAAYRTRLLTEARRLGADLGRPSTGDDAWKAKIELLLSDAVPLVSFTFGMPDRKLAHEFRRRGTTVVVTVTTADEAAAAADVADLLCVQGSEAGGHRGSFTNRDQPQTPVRQLLAEVRAVTDLPLIAAGGLMTTAHLAEVLDRGAVAAQFGTAFLRTDESGAHPLHKAALADPAYHSTALTRAFSGRPARGLVNRFMLEHSEHAPAAYPQVHHVTSPLRRAAAERGEPGAMALWAGEGFRSAGTGPAAEVVARLAGRPH